MTQDLQNPSSDGCLSLPPRLWVDWMVVFLGALVLYVATCAPDVLMADSGVYQCRVASFPPTPARHMSSDLVQVHPLYLGLAKVFTWLPVGNLAYRVNLASAWFGAMTVASVFVAVRALTASRWAATLGALSLGLGHTFWAHSVIAECLALASACLAIELAALAIFARTGRTRWFMLAGLVNGLSISNHLMGALATPVYAVLALVWWARGRLRGVHILACLGLWLLGTSIYLYIVLWTMTETGQVLRTIRSATTGPWPALNVQITPSLVGNTAGCLALQYPTLLILFAVVALWARPFLGVDRSVKWTVVGVAAVHFVFAARYPVADQYQFFVPCYAVLGVLIGLGSCVLMRRSRWIRVGSLVLSIAPVAIYAVLPGQARRFDPDLFARKLPCGDPYEFYLKPWQQGNYEARRYVEQVFGTLPSNAVLFARFTPRMALRYGQEVEGKRPDVKLVYAECRFPLDSLLRRPITPSNPRWDRPIYTAEINRYAPKPLLGICRFVREGPVYRVEPPDRWPPTRPPPRDVVERR